MHSIGKFGRNISDAVVQSANQRAEDKSRALGFAALKTTWAIQVSADRTLTETALRIALAWPHWLNSKSVLAWPAQSTIAEVMNCKPRAVRDGLKRLETGGHLFCINTYRGGRKPTATELFCTTS